MIIVFVSFIGEGGSSLGEWHEALNFAAVQKLKMIFVGENIHWALGTHVSEQSAVKRFALKAPGYGIQGITLFGTDPAPEISSGKCQAVIRYFRYRSCFMDDLRKATRFLLLIFVLSFPCAAQPKGPERHAMTRPAGSRVSSTTPAAGSARNSRPTVAPNLRRTPFVTPHSYFIWTNYYSYLSRQFDLDPLYFRRFYYNTEPLVTPEILKITLKAPLRSSLEMLDSIDELEAMFEDNQPRNLLDRQTILEKCGKIRELAKAIRNNQTLSYIDVGKGKDLYSPKSHAIQPGDFQRLREMAVDLNRQLKNLSSSTSTATVSIESYNEPSLESLAKSIEKICKAIENSSKRM